MAGQFVLVDVRASKNLNLGPTACGNVHNTRKQLTQEHSEVEKRIGWPSTTHTFHFKEMRKGERKHNDV